MTKEIIEIIKGKDHYKFSVHIVDNAKGEPAITVKARSDESLEEARKTAVKAYNDTKKEIKA